MCAGQCERRVKWEGVTGHTGKCASDTNLERVGLPLLLERVVTHPARRRLLVPRCSISLYLNAGCPEGCPARVISVARSLEPWADRALAGQIRGVEKVRRAAGMALSPVAISCMLLSSDEMF